MRTLAAALHVVLASAHVGGADDLMKGRAAVTRTGQPFCADLGDLQDFFVAYISGDQAMQAADESCSIIHTRRQAVIIKSFPGRRALKVRVFTGSGYVEGYTTRVGVELP